MPEDPLTAGLSFAEKVFSFFTGEKWDEIRKRREGDALKLASDTSYDTWLANKTSENWRRYEDAERKLAAWARSH
jgi:hypothetical protein